MITDRDQKEFNLLLRYPTTKWKKENWKSAAQLLSSAPPYQPLLARLVFLRYIDDLKDHIRNEGKTSTTKVGPKRLISLEDAESQLVYVDRIKTRLLKEGKASRETDASAARHLADYYRTDRSDARKVVLVISSNLS